MPVTHSLDLPVKETRKRLISPIESLRVERERSRPGVSAGDLKRRAHTYPLLDQ